MKKILMGLMAVSAISYAAPDLTGTVEFTSENEGKINVVGKVTSTAPVVKYVVFTSADGGITKNTQLTLPDFIVASDENAATKGFATTPTEKVYVKQVKGEELVTPEKQVYFAMEFDPFYTNVSGGYALNFQTTDAGELMSFPPTATIAKSWWETAIVGNDKLNTFVQIDDRGVLHDLSTGSAGYWGVQSVLLIVEERGVLAFGEKIVTPDSRISASIKEGVAEVLAGGVSMSSVAIKVKVM